MKAKVLIAEQLISILYDTMDGGVGGYAHIVTDDDNVEDANVDWCLDQALQNDAKGDICEETRQASIACLLYLKTLTEKERQEAINLYYK